MITIKYVDKEILYPAFGMAFPHKYLVWIRNDLPKNVQQFLIQHERYHITDESKNWIWREIKANLYGARFQFKGFMRCLWMSLAIYRLKFYMKRVSRGW